MKMVEGMFSCTEEEDFEKINSICIHKHTQVI